MNKEKLAVTAAELLQNRNRQLGNLLLAERAVAYVSILAAMLALRRRHELEPLHDDLFAVVCHGLGDDDYTTNLFLQDIGQLLRWDLISERIEKERLRGYRDVRRHKYRYRLTDETTTFIIWLESRHRDDLEPNDADTRDLLTELISTLRETSRLINKVSAEAIDYETARGLFYRLARMNALTESVSQTLSDLNIRLLGFAANQYNAATAHTILNELDRFLKQFLHRIHTLHQEIIPGIAGLRQSRYTTRWQASLTIMEEERRAVSHLMRTHLTAPEVTFARLESFYAADGTIDKLCARVNRSGMLVWQKLYAHLRELERRNHRLEDLRARIDEIALLPPDTIPSDFMRLLLAPAHMRGDMHYWDENEKALPPQPRQSQQRLRQQAQLWLDEKPHSGDRPVQSYERMRLEALAAWLRQCGLAGDDIAERLISQGDFDSFADFPRLMEVARSGILGKGARLAKIGLQLENTGPATTVTAADCSLSFDDLTIRPADLPPEP